MNAIVCHAIAGRNYLLFHYDGGYRVVEPHCHGFSTAGHEVLRGYQVEGHSTSGASEGWKLFEVAKIRELQPLDAVFHYNRGGYTPNDSALARICCEV